MIFSLDVISVTAVIVTNSSAIKVVLVCRLQKQSKLCAFNFGFCGVFENSVCFFLRISTKNTNAIVKMLVLA